MQKQIYTPNGMNLLKNKLAATESKLEIIRYDKGEVAETGGNLWHDNAGFEDLELQERMLMRTVRKLKDEINKATVTNAVHETQICKIGSLVTIVIDSKKMTFELVGHGEGDPANGKLAYNSPLGAVLCGCKAGDIKELVLYNEGQTITICKIG